MKQTGTIMKTLINVKRNKNFALNSILIGASTINIYPTVGKFVCTYARDGRLEDMKKIREDFRKAYSASKSELKVG